VQIADWGLLSSYRDSLAVFLYTGSYQGVLNHQDGLNLSHFPAHKHALCFY